MRCENGDFRIAIIKTHDELYGRISRLLARWYSALLSLTVQPLMLASGHMPTISAFYGMIIRMYHRDHAPPHFHVYYQGNEAKIDIEKLELMTGRLPRRALGLVLDWAELHQNELRHNWTLAQQRRPISTVSPLE